MQMERNRSVTSAGTTTGNPLSASMDPEVRKPKFLINSKLDFKLEGSKTIKLKTQYRVKDNASTTPKNSAAVNESIVQNLENLSSEVKRKRKELILKLRIANGK
jgi:hypothetical protein